MTKGELVGYVFCYACIFMVVLVRAKGEIPGYIPFKRKVGKNESHKRLLKLAKYKIDVTRLPFELVNIILYKALYVSISNLTIKTYSYHGLHSYSDQPAIYNKSIIDGEFRPVAWYIHGTQTHSFICGKKIIDEKTWIYA